ncbi:MBL fold metallo-hydrolase [Ferrimonas balearica]|uniref:MBL fold metallo-hydrolase n=1 Tax=Ferrimonas balearica TaxID=44012 RepID=UPI001C992C21|nr:MBL fold metallo-hydrolase [Ferrimonas balearica]MBY5992572.1 MBL fold metallo-hydrolase [Ferrimonas balearica]
MRWLVGLWVLAAPVGAATLEILHEGYVRAEQGRVGSTITLVQSDDLVLVADPGMASEEQWDQVMVRLRAQGVNPDSVTHVFISHHHPDHLTRVGVFPHAALVDYQGIYRYDTLMPHPSPHTLAPGVTVIQTPGHTREDASLLVETDEGTYLLTHMWWANGQPEIDPLAQDQAQLERSQAAWVDKVDWIVPGHGPVYPAKGREPAQ